MSDFIKTAKLNEIKEGEIKLVVVKGVEVCLTKINGEISAFKNICPHQDMPLADGILEGEELTCLYHGAKFNVKTGKVLSMPAVDDLQMLKVKVEGEDVLVEEE